MKLPSGRELKITMSDFVTSKALYMAVAEEAKSLKIDSKDDIDANLIKDALCTVLASPKIEVALHACMERATVGGARVNVSETFEAEEHRGDYFPVCLEVAKANLLPFTKSLSVKFNQLWERLKGDLKFGSKTTT